MSVLARKRAAPMSIVVALLAAAWTCEVRGSTERWYLPADGPGSTQHAIRVPELGSRRSAGNLDVARHAANGLTVKSVRLAQAALDDPEQVRAAPEQVQENEKVESLGRELAIRRHLEMLLTLRQARAEATRFKQLSESEHMELRKYLEQERVRLKQATGNGAAEPCNITSNDQSEQSAEANDLTTLRTSLQQQRDRADRLEQDLAVAKRDQARQTTLVTEATEKATQAREQAGNDIAGLRASLEQEGERAGQLETNLAAARRDVEIQTALASRMSEEASRTKRTADGDAAVLRASLQQERERGAQLENDLAAARRDIETQRALASKASEASQAKQMAQDDAAGLRTSLQQEQEHGAQLEKDLAAARHDVDMQTALAAKASAETARLKQATDESSAQVLKALQQERDKTAGLERELAAERIEDKPTTSAAVTVSRVTQDKQPAMDAIRPVAVNRAAAAAAQNNAKPGAETAAEIVRLVARASALLDQGDIGSARIVLERAAATGDAQANFALAETYDPLVLRKWGAFGTLGDREKARDLYGKAQAGGIKEARERFDALRR